MNKKEIAEIRRRLRPEKSNIGHIVGCYVTEEKKIESTFDMSLALTSEEESEKLFATIKKTLSGTYGKNLYDINFSTAQVTDSEEHKLLTALRDSELKDEKSLTALYGKIVDSFIIDGDYIIMLASDRYDVFSYSADGEVNKEESTSVFNYFICAVCPLKQTKPQLAFDKFNKAFKDTRAEFVLSSPVCGFMFPTFEDRQSNIYNALYYTGDAKDNHAELMNALFAKEAPLPAAGQKQLFGQLFQKTVVDGCDYQTVCTVQEHLCDIILEHKDSKSPEPLLIDKTAFADILKVSGVSEENIASFTSSFDEEFGNGAQINPENVIDTAKIEVKTPEAMVKIDTDFGELVETRVIDGKKYIMIRADSGVEVNGINIKIEE